MKQVADAVGGALKNSLAAGCLAKRLEDPGGM